MLVHSDPNWKINPKRRIYRDGILHWSPHHAILFQFQKWIKKFVVAVVGVVASHNPTLNQITNMISGAYSIHRDATKSTLPDACRAATRI